MNIVEVLGLEIASFGAWESTTAEVFSATKPERPAYRKLLWQGDRIIGAMLLGPEQDVWTTNDVGMLKGLVQSGYAWATGRAICSTISLTSSAPLLPRALRPGCCRRLSWAALSPSRCCGGVVAERA